MPGRRKRGQQCGPMFCSSPKGHSSRQATLIRGHRVTKPCPGRCGLFWMGYLVPLADVLAPAGCSGWASWFLWLMATRHFVHVTASSPFYQERPCHPPDSVFTANTLTTPHYTSLTLFHTCCLRHPCGHVVICTSKQGETFPVSPEISTAIT